MNNKQLELITVLEKEGRTDLAKEIQKEFTDCKGCDKCCKYVLFEVAFQNNYSYLEYLLYHNITLFVDKELKTIDALIETVCNKLKDGKCSIYETKPQICNEYSNIVCLEKKPSDMILIIKTIEELEHNKELIMSMTKMEKECINKV